MIATAHHPTQPPHLLASSALPYPSDMSAHAMAPHPSRQTHTALSHPIISSNEGSSTGRGIKSLFSRNRVASPEPDPTLRARLRSFIGENKAGPSRQAPTSSTGRTARSRRPGPEPKQALTSDQTQKGQPRGRDGHGSRPGSPDQAKRSAIRFGPSLIPAIQKGEDGKWQPPSLSRGSMSTSALALYADGENEDAAPKAKVNADMKSLAVMFDSKDQSGENGEKWQGKVSRPTSRQSLKSPIIPPKSASSDAMAPPTEPIRALASTPQSSVAQLSQNHYHLRLATSYLIRVLTPFLRGSGFAANEKMLEMKKKADEHISALGRMEKGWGGDWTKAARSVGEGGAAEGSPASSVESKVRAVSVSERAKERERRVWVDVMRDGILLCLLLNQLFPASPQHIARVNITEDGILRATNLTRFQTACQIVGLSEADIFGLTDVLEGSENGLGRVAGTVIALARLAGRSKAAVSSKSPTTPSPRKTPGHSRAPSRAGSSAPASDASPRARTASPRPISPVSIMITHEGLPNRAEQLERSGAMDMANNLHAKLEIDTSITGKMSMADDPAYRTPNTSIFVDSAEESPRRSPLHRSTTQVNISPHTRPLSPPPTASPSRSSASVARPLAASGRPTLRPRYTTGSKVSVSFAPGTELPLSPRSAASDRSSVTGVGYGGHSRERTPSLISSASRVTSGYTRSSAAFSVATVVGDEHAVDLVDDDPGNSMRMRMRERRMSEKTLHNARQKILGTLLSSDDLPEDLRRALEKEASGNSDDPRDQAITQSLATLEGWKTPSSPHRTVIDASPRRTPSRPVSRCGDVTRVAEEDELSSVGGSVKGGSRVSLVRRTSANGKVYVPKRSESPAHRDSSTSPNRPTAFPASNLSAEESTPASPTSSLILPKRPTSKVERRQSDGISYANAGLGGEDRPLMSARNNSMVNLGAVGTSSSIFRESLLRASQSQPLQILEINEPGFPPVRYQVGNCVGRGQFGSVYRSLNLSTGQMVAIKRIKLDGIKVEEVDDVMHEVELLKKLAHPSIVRYEGMSRDDEYLNIVLEYIENGSLVQTLKSFGRFNEQLISSYVAKILEGLDYLHSQGVVHCDLKAANILSTKNGNVKLSDFGVSLMMKAVENLQTDAASRSKGDKRKSKETVQGSPNWMAPEVINLQGATTASDIWSLGCTIVELLTGQPPYSDLPNSMAVLWHIVMDTEPPIPASIGGDLRDFLELCFIKDPEKRPAAVVLFEHPWIKKLNPDLAMRPQDSVPFLRRVSMDLRRVDSTRLFSSDLSGVLGSRNTSYADVSEASKRYRYSLASSHGREASEGPTRDHELIKTTFGKAIICRICHASVKKGGVLCQHCGLICHTHCVSKASTRCDITEQLALLARQQEYLTQHPHIGISAASSRRPSFNDDDARDSGPFTALPVKILAGIKRSRSTRSPAVGARNQGRSRSSSNVGKSFPTRTSLERPSLDVSGRSADSHSRASVFTDGSVGTSEGHDDPRKRSAIRFELNDEAHGRTEPDEVGEDVKKVKVDEEVDVVVARKGKANRRDNRSDCVVM